MQPIRKLRSNERPQVIIIGLNSLSLAVSNHLPKPRSDHIYVRKRERNEILRDLHLALPGWHWNLLPVAS